jgi:hypothetical protein
MNTERTPQTFLEVPGLCSSIMKIPANPVVPLRDLQGLRSSPQKQ